MRTTSKPSATSCFAALLLAATLAFPAQAQSTASVLASENLSAASGVVLSGSAAVLAASGELIVVGVEQTARGVSVVLRNAADASGQVVALLMDGAAAASLGAGKVLQASATATGFLLTASGQAIAFIPNEIGMALVHHSRHHSR